MRPLRNSAPVRCPKACYRFFSPSNADTLLIRQIFDWRVFFSALCRLIRDMVSQAERNFLMKLRHWCDWLVWRSGNWVKIIWACFIRQSCACITQWMTLKCALVVNTSSNGFVVIFIFTKNIINYTLRSKNKLIVSTAFAIFCWRLPKSFFLD
jgi:hypothetical protein